MTQHTEDLHNVIRTDSVTIETTEGEVFDAECVSRSDEVDDDAEKARTKSTWTFSAAEYRPVAVITQGPDSDLTIHRELFDQKNEGRMGYIESVEIHGVLS